MGLVGFIVKVTSWFVVRVACYWDFGDTLADYLQVMCEVRLRFASSFRLSCLTGDLINVNRTRSSWMT